MIRWFLFETRIGDLVLYLFEALTGLAIVDQEYLAGLLTPLVSPDEGAREMYEHRYFCRGVDEVPAVEREDGYLDKSTYECDGCVNLNLCENDGHLGDDCPRGLWKVIHA
jgi:hypothetical protein